MKIRFGMLATDAFGKAGGQAIQRRGSIRVLRNITIPTQRFASTSNPQRLINTRFFSSWSFLPAETRSQWSLIGSNLTTKNGWGEEKTLSGREAYVKCNSLAFPFINIEIDANLFDYVTPLADISLIQVNASTSLVSIDFSNVSDIGFLQFKAMPLRTLAQNPLIDKLKTFGRVETVFDESELFDNMEQVFGTLQPGQLFSVAVRPISLFGIVGVWFQMQVIVQ